MDVGTYVVVSKLLECLASHGPSCSWRMLFPVLDSPALLSPLFYPGLILSENWAVLRECISTTAIEMSKL